MKIKTLKYCNLLSVALGACLAAMMFAACDDFAPFTDADIKSNNYDIDFFRTYGSVDPQQDWLGEAVAKEAMIDFS